MASHIASADVATPVTRRQLRQAEPTGSRRSRRQPADPDVAAPDMAAGSRRHRVTVGGAADLRSDDTAANAERAGCDAPVTRVTPANSCRPSGRPHPLVRWGGRSGVLVALAAVTVAVPLTLSDDSSQAATGESTLDESLLPSTVEVLTSSTSSSLVPPSSLLSADASATRSDLATSRSETREILPGCSGEVTDPDAANGELSESDLCTLWDNDTQLRADAATALAELNEVYVAKFGSDMCLSSGYRTLAQQAAVKASRGSLAAAAGKSNHGFGLAIDFCTTLTTGEQWEWLNENAATFGWENPAWAQSGGSGPYERWHWEYTKVQTDGFYYGE